MTQFHTNIDCAKRHVHNLNDVISREPREDIQFQVGDTIVVFQHPEFHLQLKVVNRKWTFGGSYGPTLHVELGLGSGFENISQLEKVMKNRGYNW